MINPEKIDLVEITKKIKEYAKRKPIYEGFEQSADEWLIDTEDLRHIFGWSVMMGPHNKIAHDLYKCFVDMGILVPPADRQMRTRINYPNLLKACGEACLTACYKRMEEDA